MRHDSREVLTRPAPPPDFTVTYGGHADHVADVRLPALCRRGAWSGSSEGTVSLVLFLHGGFWRDAYDRVHTGPLAAALAGEGFAVATPEYRRTGSPGGGWPGTFDDVALAVRTVPRLVAAHADVDPHRVILAGHSAGGQLALWAAARVLSGAPGTPGTPGTSATPASASDGTDPGGPDVPGASRSGGPMVAGVVALAAVSDLRSAYELDLDDGAVAALLGGGPDEVPDRYAATDPLALVPIGARLMLLHGGADRQVPVEFSRRLAARAAEAGDDADLVELSGADHFAPIDPLSEAWRSVVDLVRAAGRPAGV